MILLSEIFTITTGSNLNLNSLSIVNFKTGIPYVSRSKMNNGVVAYVEKNNKHKLNKGGSITVVLVGDNVMKSFYHKYDYYTSQNMVILTPKENLTEYELIYYCKCIESNKIKYSYGRTPKSSLNDIYIPKNIPIFINNRDLPILNIKEIKDPNYSWEEVKITDIFEIVSSKKYVTINSLTIGKVPIVSASEYNNGISSYANVLPEFNFKCLTLSKNGSVGEVFYQNDPFSVTTDILVLKPKFEINEMSGIFFSTLLSKYFKHKFYYGRKISIAKLTDSTIKIPLINGKIDLFKIQSLMNDLNIEYYSHFNKTTNLQGFINI